MKIQKEIKVCDICGTELHENKFLAKDSSFSKVISHKIILICAQAVYVI